MHMISTEILKADLLDIVFENRNKQYGAYKLRKNYPGRLGLSLGMALSSIFLLFLFTGSRKDGPGLHAKSKDYNLIDAVIPSVKPPQPPILPKKAVASQASTSQKIFTDEFRITTRDIIQVIPRMEDLENQVSDKDLIGPPGNGSSSSPVVSNGAGVENPVTENPKKEMAIQREPEFPGGMKAWINYLSRNLRVPDELEAGEKKTVLIRFLVDVDGQVTGFEVVHSAGPVYDNEVIRVLRKMPRWKPAIQNNLAVARTFTQPVIFMGLEQ